MTENFTEPVAAILLAAGKSTRMRSDLPKVLHDVCGAPMLAFSLAEARAVGLSRLIVVVGHARESVLDRFSDARDVAWVTQAEQRGTGHAVMCCREALAGFRGTVLVIAGDMPLVRRETLKALATVRVERGDAISIATTELDDPTGYGRIVRDVAGNLVGIVEHRDCTSQQHGIREVNPSYYCFAAEQMFAALDRVKPSPGKGELYLTDAIAILRDSGQPVSAVVKVPREDAMGVNSREDLAVVNRAMQARLQRAHMEQGVTLISPENTWIEANAEIGRDTTIYPFSYVGRGARIGEGCRIGPFAGVASGAHVPAGSVIDSTGREGRL